MKYSQLFVLLMLFPALLMVACKQPVKPVSVAKVAKPVPDIAGVYYTDNGGDPEGGGALYVLPDHRFLIGFFGGILTGTWQTNDTAVLFKPQVKPVGFKVYGRYNKKLGKNIHIFFEGFAGIGTPAIGFEPLTKKAKRVLDDSPRNADFSYTGEFAGIPQGILLAARVTGETGQAAADSMWQIYVYSNSNKYNDFIAKYTPISAQPKSQNFYGTIKAGKLDFDHKKSDKKPFTKSDRELVEQLLSIPADPDIAFYSPYYIEPEPGFERDTLKYRFNAQKDAYIKLRGYTEGEENQPEKRDGSNGLNILYQYHELKASMTSGKVTLDPKPIKITKVRY